MENENLYSKGTVVWVACENRIRKAVILSSFKVPETLYTIHYLDSYPHCCDYECIHPNRITGITDKDADNR